MEPTSQPIHIDTQKLAEQSIHGTIRITVGAMNRHCQITYYKNSVKQDIRGTLEEIADHINQLSPEPTPMTEATLQENPTMTQLFQGGSVEKTNPQIIAAGDCEELSAAIGLAKSLHPNIETREVLEEIQNDLEQIRNEIALDRYAAEVDEIKLNPKKLTLLMFRNQQLGAVATNPTLSGQSHANAALWLAKAVCRRCERSALAIEENHRASVTTLAYLNQLSKFLGRVANKTEG